MGIRSERHGKIVYTIVTGAFDHQSAMAHIDFLCANKGNVEFLFEFHDYSNIDIHLLSEAELISISKYAKKVSQVYKKSFVAVYAPDDISFGIARQYRANAEMQGNKTIVTIFRVKAEALQCLEDQIKEHG